MTPTNRPPMSQAPITPERLAEIAELRYRTRTITESNQALTDLLAEVSRLTAETELDMASCGSAELRSALDSAMEVVDQLAEYIPDQQMRELRARWIQATTDTASLLVQQRMQRLHADLSAARDERDRLASRVEELFVLPATDHRPQKCGGKLCLQKTRFTIAQLLAELADGSSLSDVCEDYDLDHDDAKEALHGIAARFGNSMSESASALRTELERLRERVKHWENLEAICNEVLDSFNKQGLFKDAATRTTEAPERGG